MLTAGSSDVRDERGKRFGIGIVRLSLKELLVGIFSRRTWHRPVAEPNRYMIRNSPRLADTRERLYAARRFLRSTSTAFAGDENLGGPRINGEVAFRSTAGCISKTEALYYLLAERKKPV